MHRLDYKDWTFNFNGDFSGDVRILTPGGVTVWLPFEAMKALVAEYVRARRMTALEDASPDDLLVRMSALEAAGPDDLLAVQ